MNFSTSLVASVLLAVLLPGCQNKSASLVPQETTKYSIEGTGKFALVDRAVQTAITCTGLQEKLNEASLLEVIANIKNRESHAANIQVRCIFKDADGFTTGDETAWQSLALESEATEAVHFTASNNRARKYTVFVRSSP